MPRLLEETFEATIQKSSAKGGWTFVVWPGSADFFRTKGLVKVRATVEEIPFQSSFMALGDGRHKLPLKADLLNSIGKQPGDMITIKLIERLN